MIGTPVDIGRDEARELARDELSKPSYDQDRPILQRILEWIVEQVNRLLDSAVGAFSSRWGIAILVALVIAVAVVVIVRTGPLARRSARKGDPVFADGRRTAAEHRAAADAAATAGEWQQAVVERFRAIVAGLEERGVLDERRGRTADETAREAGALLPAVADDLDHGARLFDAVHYGDHAARSEDDARLRALDAAVAAARPVPGEAIAEPSLAAPR